MLLILLASIALEGTRTASFLLLEGPVLLASSVGFLGADFKLCSEQVSYRHPSEDHPQVSFVTSLASVRSQGETFYSSGGVPVCFSAPVNSHWWRVGFTAAADCPSGSPRLLARIHVPSGVAGVGLKTVSEGTVTASERTIRTCFKVINSASVTFQRDMAA